jgi:CheY-like chemotaxis protein
VALKILLADDSMTAQNMGKKILVDAGYDVVAVSNGAAAIKKIASEHPDIAILDEYMPGYTGSEVCERVKASVETAKMPVLLTVGKMEAFDPEKANKVHADGVMIKPFEASDLIAAVQAIAQRLLAPAPARGLEMGTVQLRQGHGVSIEDTQRITASIATAAGHEDTLRVAPPTPSTGSYEETLRLTAQQIKAFQDSTYHDWKNTAEPHLEEHEKKAAAAEIAVTPAVQEPEPSPPAMASMVETPVASRETPVFSAMAASGVAAETSYLNGSTGPAARVEEPAPEAPSMPAFYTPPEEEEEPLPVPAFGVRGEMATPESVTKPVVAEVAVEPVMEAAPAPLMVEPGIAPVAPIVETVMEPVVEPEWEAAPVLETSAPLTSGPMLVVPVVGLEPTIAPAVEIAATTVHELEVTSPAQEHGAIVEQDSALVTDTEDLSQFATRFGMEGAEPTSVGVVSDLSEEQMAAITTPVEEPVAAEPAPVAFAEPAVEKAPTAVPVTPTVDTPIAASPVEEEVGAIGAVEPLDDEPMVAYVPGIQDTQPFMAMRQEEAEPEVVAAPKAEVAHDVTEPERVVEPAVLEPVAAEVAEPEVTPTILEPATVAETEPVVGEPERLAADAPVAHVEEHVASAVAALAQAVHPQEPVAPHTEMPTGVEAALAAAAGIAAAAVAHAIHPEPLHVAEPEIPALQQYEPVGDAALAEELAAALATKETEERATGVSDAAGSVALEPTAGAVVSRAAEMEGVPDGFPDNKVADAVGRAFESLKPQLIAEIMKHLKK